MNTQAHALLNYFVLRKRVTTSGWPIFWGAILPDLPMLVFYVFEKFIRGQSETVIWSTLYFQEHWQDFIDVFNSVPVFLLIFGLGRIKKSQTLQLLSLSALIHIFCDFFLHREDAHRHFFPLSDYRFVSPISYWDPKHGGHYVGGLEFILFLGASVWLWPRLQSKWSKAGVILGNAVYLITYTYFYLIFS